MATPEENTIANQIEQDMEDDTEAQQQPTKKGKKSASAKKEASPKASADEAAPAATAGGKAPKKGLGAPRKPRVHSRPYKKMDEEKLEFNIEQLQDRVNIMSNKLDAYNIRLRKFVCEKGYRAAEEKK